MLLRPATEADLPLLHAWDNDPTTAGPYDEVGHATLEQTRALWLTPSADPRRTDRRVLDAGGRAVGIVTWIRHPLDAWVGLFGLAIADPADRGQGLGTLAHRLTADWIFGEHEDLAKLEAWADVQHVAERQVLLQLGYALEGTLRRRNRLADGWRDLCVYGLLREEWETGAPAPGGEAPIMTVLAVADLARSTAFYEAVFGWPRRIDVPVLVELALPGGGGLALYQQEAFAHNTAQLPIAPPEGAITGTELYFHCGDLDAALERIEAAGGRLLTPRSPRPWGDEAAYYADLDGNVVALGRPLGPPEPPDG